MQTPSPAQQEQLQALVHKQSKHSDYQTLHPWISSLVSEVAYQPSGKVEAQRQAYMCSHSDFSGKSILDIGANTGYFSFAALQAGATHVHAYEGNQEHATFINQAASIIGLQDKLNVHNKYFDFQSNPDSTQAFDISLCLNVLHHLGDDFGNQELSIDEAKRAISAALHNLTKYCQTLWFQIGFNWKGNKNTPLFKNGRKQELIDFIQASCENDWNIDLIGIFNPKAHKYENITSNLLERFDSVGEFLNRPFFLMSKK